MKKPWYDVKCEELAEHFLADEPTLMPSKRELAHHIQETVEDWFVSKRIRAETAAANQKPRTP